jgi:hypothetical protein
MVNTINCKENNTKCSVEKFKNLTTYKMGIKKIVVIFIATSFFSACKKKNTAASLSENYDNSNASIVVQGNFSSGKHPTSGCIRLYDKAGVKSLVFEGFKTDNGPALRVFLSKAADNKDYIDLGSLKAVSGNFNYTIDSSINTNNHTYVVIWCQQYSVLFGYSSLK